MTDRIDHEERAMICLDAAKGAATDQQERAFLAAAQVHAILEVADAIWRTS